MTDLQNFFLGLFSGIVVGIVVGLIVEHTRLKNTLKIERIKRLAPQLELVHPVLERIQEDGKYLRVIQSRDDDFKELVSKICQSFEEYRTWYKVFRENGLKPELEHSSKYLYALINGIFVHAQMTEKYGIQHILSNIEGILEKICDCQKEVGSFLNQ